VGIVKEWLYFLKKKGSLVHVPPACAVFGDGSNNFGSYVRNLSLHFCKMLFSGLETMTSWSQGNNFTAAPWLLFNGYISLRSRIHFWLNQYQ
jgi:hypothetical protein